jgi:hypothetical protein
MLLLRRAGAIATSKPDSAVTFRQIAERLEAAKAPPATHLLRDPGLVQGAEEVFSILRVPEWGDAPPCTDRKTGP